MSTFWPGRNHDPFLPDAGEIRSTTRPPASADQTATRISIVNPVLQSVAQSSDLHGHGCFWVVACPSCSQVNWVTASQRGADLVGECDRHQPLLKGGTRVGVGPDQEPALENAAILHQ